MAVADFATCGKPIAVGTRLRDCPWPEVAESPSDHGAQRSAEHDPIRHCIIDAGRRRHGGVGTGLWPARAIPIHAAAADQGIAIVATAELCDDSGRGAAGAGTWRVGRGALPCQAGAQGVRAWSDPPRLYGPRTQDPRAVGASRDVRRPRFQLCACWCVLRIGP